MARTEADGIAAASCIELVTGHQFSGVVTVSRKALKADIFAFDEPHNLLEERTVLHLRTHENMIISLHNIIWDASGINTAFNPTRRTVRRLRVTSNVAVVGDEIWQETDIVRHVSFKLHAAERVLMHRSTRRQRRSDGELFKDTHIFTIKTPRYTCRASQIGNYSWQVGSMVSYEPIFEIDYGQAGTSLSQYMEDIGCIGSFFSLAVGAWLRPNTIRICRSTRRQIMLRAAKNDFPSIHLAFYRFRSQPEIPTSFGPPFVLSLNKTETGHVAACLAEWIARFSAWKGAMRLMVSSLELHNEITAERLLNACRWLEEIPTAKAAPAIAEADIKQIAEQAVIKAKQLGYSDKTKRIRGAVRAIRIESNEDRFERLRQRINDRIGEGKLPPKVTADLVKAIAVRGVAAHGHYQLNKDTDFIDLEISIYAVEALCYFLTVTDLPVSKEGMSRLSGHWLATNYLYRSSR